jgi:hypothetical protein
MAVQMKITELEKLYRSSWLDGTDWTGVASWLDRADYTGKSNAD